MERRLRICRRLARYAKGRTGNGNIDAEGGAGADLAIRAVTNRGLLRVRFAFDPEVAAMARAVDFHGFVPFARPCTHKAAGQLMSAQHPTASEKRTSPKFAFGPGGDVAEHVSPALRSRECGDCARPAQPRSRRVENAHRPRRSRVRCVE